MRFPTSGEIASLLPLSIFENIPLLSFLGPKDVQIGAGIQIYIKSMTPKFIKLKKCAAHYLLTLSGAYVMQDV